MYSGPGWPEERVETLRALWQAGYSCSQIVAQLQGGLTRNAVISKLHRIGLSGASRSVRQPASAPAQPRGAKQPSSFRAPPVKAKTPQTPKPSPAATPVVKFASSGGCKWPLGDPQRDGFHFCNARKAEIGPYCEQHRAIAFVPQTPRKSGTELARSLRRYI